jgi:hypothetical protein
MAGTITRRPLPALVALVALLALTALVWWRVLHRGHGDDAGTKATPTPCPTTTTTTTAAPGPVALPAASTVTVQVLNSTQRAGLAGKVRTTLIKDGFKSPAKAGNDTDADIPGPAEIRFGPNGRAGAQLLAYYFPGSKLVAGTSTTATVVVSLGDKYSSVASPAAVQAAVSKASAAPSPTPSASPSASC